MCDVCASSHSAADCPSGAADTTERWLVRIEWIKSAGASLEVAEEAAPADAGAAAEAVLDEAAPDAPLPVQAAARASSGSMNSTFNARPGRACETRRGRKEMFQWNRAASRKR